MNMSTPQRAQTLAVLGAGHMALAVSRIARAADVRTLVWARRPQAASELAAQVDGVEVVDTLAQACTPADVIFMAVPADAFADVARQYGEVARPDHMVLHATRGVGEGFVLPHELVRAESCARKVGVLGGPLYARELGSGRPLAAVIASRYAEVHAVLDFLAARAALHLYPSTDVAGVEIAGAMANVTALAVGVADGLDLGETVRGLLLMRGLHEGALLGRALGADPATFAGLAGVGDLVPRRVSSTDRHRGLGVKLAQGVPLTEILATTDGRMEGVTTAREAKKKAHTLGLRLPLVDTVVDILLGHGEPRQLIETVLAESFDLGSTLSRRAT